MGKNHPALDIIEAYDRDTGEAVRIFEAGQDVKDPPAWTRAVVNRERGLTLIDDRRGAGFHFARLLCGHRGPESSDCAVVLAKAGFGELKQLKQLKAILRHGNDHTFTHPTNGR